jgi:predicted MPP superfamily phosphohydrolase
MATIGGRLLWKRSVAFHQPRREFLRAAATTMAIAPVAAAGYGRYIAQRDPLVREVELPVDGLHPDLSGLRIVQISDLHLSEFVSRREVARAVDLANELRPHLTLVTGDLITSTGDPLDECIRELSRLRADAGIYGCMGNHEIVAGSEDYTAEHGADAGVRFLRCRNVDLRFGTGHLNLAGIDYQRRGRPYLVGTHALVRKECLNVLMSHNPDVFPAAVRQGWDVTIAGHTHGGQITLEYLHPALNPARFYTPFVYGAYSIGARRLYVTSGVGTVGVPVRLNTTPEIALLRLKTA